MDNWALVNLIEDWDNTGFQIGDDNKEVKKIGRASCRERV